MRRHPFDPVSLVFGLAFAAAAVIVLAGGELVDDGQFLLPATLLGLGVALLVQNARRSRPADDDSGRGAGSADPDEAHEACQDDAAASSDSDIGSDSSSGSDDIDWSAFAPDETPRRGTVDWPGA